MLKLLVGKHFKCGKELQLDEKCKIVIETNTKYSAKNSRIEQMSETIIQTDYFCKNLTKYSKEYTKNKTNIE